MTVLLLIPARGGSKSIPRKNLAELGGRPLIEWVIAAATQSRAAASVAVSSDDEEILETATRAGVGTLIRRPDQLAGDLASSADTALHAMDALADAHNVVALVQPTSPFVAGEDIDACIALCLAREPHSAVSIVRSAESPYWAYQVDDTGRLTAVVEGPRPKRRQDAPTTYRLNGAVFVASRAFLEAHGDFVGPGTRGHVMPAARSVDIDEPEDLDFARYRLARGDNSNAPPGNG